MWISPKRQVWAFHRDNWSMFFDGLRHEKYEYRPGEKQIVKMLLREDEAQRIQPVDYMSQGWWLFGTEEVVSQKRREVWEAGKKWIEFDVEFSRGDIRSGTLRVDPETRLPVFLAMKSYKCLFDYPADGPSDIYAVGVPATITIDDRMPSEACLQVLRGMAASRARIGGFRLVVTVDVPNQGFGSIVWRKGDRWRIDSCSSTGPRSMRGAKPPDGLGWGDPAAQKLGLFWVAPKYICDGKMVYQNTVTVADYLNTGTNGATTVKWQASPSVTPQALLSVEGRGYGLVPNATIVSLVYPDLSPRRGWGFEFDPRPADAPACVLIKISAHLATKEPTVGHEWYYIDPSKGYAVVRAEYFNLPANVPADPKAAERKSTTRMDDFQQSPQGFWYPKLVHESDSRTVHYHFDFDVAVPDSLFVIGDTGKPKK